jgi:hypothetical protein
MLARALAIPLHRAAQLAQPILVQGPRSAGKTTLLRREFPAHPYLPLDDPALRGRARQDPATFLARLRGPAFVDDLHRAPELIAHLAAEPAAGRLILASSRRLTLPLTTFELHPPTRAELERRPPLTLAMLGHFVPAPVAPALAFPPWPPVRSYLDHDLPDLIQVRDRDRFERFAQAAAARSGQILDQQALARECEVSHRTAVRWLAVLETCFQTVRIPPAPFAFGRRLVRAPKLHFLTSDHLESRVLATLASNAHHAGTPPRFAYWRDSNGLEIPLLLLSDLAPPLPIVPVAELHPLIEARLRRWMQLAGVTCAALITNQPGPSRRGGLLRYGLAQL